jgi:glycosyltransferase involved in cell wall biosynthesis
MTPQITVIVPLYNKAAFIARSLDSIAHQTFPHFEALIIDDGSTDEGPAIAAAYPDPRFRIVRQTNQGPGAARNRGLAEASTGLVAFLDADDEWLPDYLSWAVETLADSPAAACACSYFEEPSGSSSETFWRGRGLVKGLFKTTPDMSPQLFTYTLAFLSPCTTVARTGIVRQWGGFYDRSRCLYGEDAFLWLKVLLNHPVALDLHPRVRIHREASDLSNTRRGPHTLEPFLEHPEEIEADCPAPLKQLLRSFFAIRAFKAACVLAYWGQWRPAKMIRSRFPAQRRFRLPLFWTSLLCATPAGAAAGWLWRRLSPR